RYLFRRVRQMLGVNQIRMVKLSRRINLPAALVQKTAHEIKREVREYCLIVEGAYLSESEAEHALRDPFIEDWVEQTGHFRIHNMNEIQIAPGVTLGSLGVVMLDDRLFEIASTDPEHPLTEHKAKGVAEALRRQDMFDEIRTEPREEELVNDGA
ncbi:MAG TPA: hypothetical protein VIJ87_08140, partial [Pyrinomonadaceae bacterium]